MTAAKVKTKKTKKAKAKTAKAKTGKSAKKKTKTVNKRELARLVEDIIDQGADTSEEINRAVLDLPVKVLVKLGLVKPAKEMRRIQDASIGTVYKIIHDINHEVADLASDLLKKRKGKKK